MKHLSRQQLDELRHLLEEGRARLFARSGSEDLRLPADGAEPADLQDGAREERDRSAYLASTRLDRARLEEVEGALARIEAGSYGICEETDEPIPFERLRAQPTARHTVEAQELLEAEAEADAAENDPSAY